MQSNNTTTGNSFTISYALPPVQYAVNYGCVRDCGPMRADGDGIGRVWCSNTKTAPFYFLSRQTPATLITVSATSLVPCHPSPPQRGCNWLPTTRTVTGITAKLFCGLTTTASYPPEDTQSRSTRAVEGADRDCFFFFHAVDGDMNDNTV